jgi:hypothetical protein
MKPSWNGSLLSNSGQPSVPGLACGQTGLPPCFLFSNSGQIYLDLFRFSIESKQPGQWTTHCTLGKLPGLSLYFLTGDNFTWTGLGFLLRADYLYGHYVV